MMFYIRWMIMRDMPSVLAIESESYPDPWSEGDFRESLQNRNTIGMVAEHDSGEIVAYMVYELHRKHIAVPRLAVHPKYRLGGIGREMLEKLKSKLHPDRRNRINIELRETNLDGHLFLKACGFQAVEVLRRSYDDEDYYLFQFRCKTAVESEWRSW